MITLQDLVTNYPFAKSIFDALPCGLIVITEEGFVLSVNKLVKEVFGLSDESVTGKPFGHALGCLNAVEGSEDCGFISDCRLCALRDLAISSISKSQKQKVQTNLVVSIKGQVREIPLRVRILPLEFSHNRFAIFIVEHLQGFESVPAISMNNGFRGIFGRSAVMQELFDSIRQIARTDAPVLIQGESGTGKELVAHALHKESQRTNKNFVPVNCGALPEGLLESELFGHLKGAFTGANNTQKGRFSIADGGTLFLDEVGELSPAIQVKFLRVLQNGCFEPVGSDHSTCVDVRIISATNSELDQVLRNGRFRQDLYYRLSVMPITVPPLRARKEDIPILCGHFLSEFSKNAWTQKAVVSPEVADILMNYDWPGNVRELRNVLQYACVRTTSGLISPADLPPNFHPPDIIKRRYRRKHRLKLNQSQVAEALEMARGNKQKAAEILGVSRSTLYRFFDSMDGSHTLRSKRYE